MRKKNKSCVKWKLAGFVGVVLVGGLLYMKNAPIHLADHPLNAPEQALEKILDTNRSDENLFRVIIENPNKIHLPESSKKYESFFSKSLIHEFARKEKEAVEKNCAGKYDENSVCGIDYDPLICAQNYPKEVTYKTLEETEDFAIIECTEYSAPKQFVKYRMVKNEGKWVLDAVLCPSQAEEFNWNNK